MFVDSQTRFGPVGDVEEGHAEECLFHILVREIMKGNAGGCLWARKAGKDGGRGALKEWVKDIRR